MEAPVIDRLSDLQLGFNSLKDPSFLSQVTSSLAGVQSVSIAFNFCKWGAVILALVAAFGSIINRVTIFIIRFLRKRSSLPSFPLLSEFDDDDYSASDDDDDETCSSSEFEDDVDEPAASSSFRLVDGYFRATGAGHHLDDQLQSGNRRLLRRRSIGEIFSLSEIANSKSVVKLWDSIGFGLGLDFDDSYSSSADGVFSVYDVNKEHRMSSIFGGERPTPAVCGASPAVLVFAGENESGNLALKIWDTRIRRRKPTVIAEWGPSLGKTVRVESGGVQKVYVRDDGRVTVGDVRKVSSPLVNVTESDADTWWDADAVIVSDESYGEDSSVLQPT